MNSSLTMAPTAFLQSTHILPQPTNNVTILLYRFTMQKTNRRLIPSNFDRITITLWWDHSHLCKIMIAILFSCFPNSILMCITGNKLEAEASWGILGAPCLVPKNAFQFLRGEAYSVHTAYEEGHSSGLPYFDLPTTNGSDCGSLWGIWLGLLRHLH